MPKFATTDLLKTIFAIWNQSKFCGLVSIFCFAEKKYRLSGEEYYRIWKSQFISKHWNESFY